MQLLCGRFIISYLSTFPDQQPDRHGDPEMGRREPAGWGSGEMGGGGRHLPLSPQLQRCA